MDDFNTIRLRRKIIEKFKEYSRKTSPSYSETLEYMIAYFEDSGISPYDTIYNPILASTIAINRRTDYIIALLKNIEKTQLIPTRLMLESLFKLDTKEKKPLLIEKKALQENNNVAIDSSDELLEFYRIHYEKNQERVNTLKHEYFTLIEQLTFTKSNFSKNHFRLDISQEELENLKLKIKKV